MVLIFLGPPGAGKGTQAARLAQDLNLKKISTGDILRAHVAQGTELGRKVKPIMDRGDLVPDELILAIIKEELEQMPEVRAIFDGFPRTTAQAEALDRLLETLGAPIHKALLLEVPTEELVARLLKRAELEGRSDDNEETVRRRLEVYAEKTQPLVDYYAARGVLVRANGVGTVDEVYRRIREAL
ncbi:adenylate kinase [Marinithermus hydrothermalis]|uniref:Adenylate kinase n=1 Tax=Marinithermus hydrothermalis (strain DSM 14884 / JCM 11576 / T1) TaxID=869210 RepID=F2NMQ6_MARHT|nr:adenylate kinase [Marinithermus hydrothermalis]AEB12440.1 Adenylate kinase [Marinithermus hydrothermalis DSM 14884]